MDEHSFQVSEASVIKCPTILIQITFGELSKMYYTLAGLPNHAQENHSSLSE